MATTEADIPEPVCETIREDEKRNMVDEAAKKVTKEEKTSTDNKPHEPPKTLESNIDVKEVEKSNECSASTIESEIFLKSPLIAEVSFEAKNLSPDACKVTENPEKIMKDDTDIAPIGNAKLNDQPLEITASEEEIILEEIKENAEESNGKYGEKSLTSVPSTVDSAVSNLGTKAGDIIYDPGQEDIEVEIQISKETSTEDDGTTNSFTTETGSSEENLCQTSLQSRESKGSEIPNISEVKNLNPKVTTLNDESGRTKTTKDEIPCILITEMSTEGENPSDQNETVNENTEKNAEEVVAGSFLKSKTTDETSSENAVEEEMSYDGSKKTGLPILIDRANEEIKERKNGDNAKNLSCSPLVTAEIEEISSEQDELGNELHNNAEEACQEKNLDTGAMTAVILHEYELQGENESESSFLKERDDVHIQKGDKTVTTPEYSEKIMEISGKKSQEEVGNQSKTQEENITIHTNPTGTEETEENPLIQNDGSQMKDKVHLGKENEKPCFTDVSMRDTNDNESTATNEDEELREAELSENKKDMESTLVVNATTEKYTEFLKVADVEPSISFQNTETSSLEEKNQTANLQEILCDKIEQASDVVDRKEETLKNNLTLAPNEETEENSTIEVDGSQMKGEEHLEEENKMAYITEALATDISDNKSTLMLEDKMKDADLRKDELIKNQTGSESAMLNQEATMEKPIDSLQVAPEDIKASTSDQDTKTSSLKNQILTENPQEILDDKTESKACGIVDEEKETLEDVPTIELNDDNEDNSVIKEYGSEMKYEESLEKVYEKPSVKEDSIRDAIDDKSTYMQEDKFEDKDLRKAEIFENKKDIENTLLKEETTVMKPIEFLQLDPEEIRTYASDHGTETASLNASSRDGIAEDITIDAADMKEETVENVTISVSNEDIEEKPTIKMDSSQIKEEEYLEREGKIPLTIEALTGKTGDDESIINHVDNTENEDLRKAELLESEKNTESTLLNKETQMEIPIKSLQVVAEDIIASASCLGSTSSHQERKLNAHENLGQQIEDKTINAADTKEKTPEAQNVTTIFSNEKSKEENSLIQMDESNRKHEELLEKEGMLSLSEILVVETNNEESKIIHEEKDTESTLLKEGLQVDKPIESLKVGFEDNEASVSCQDREATSSLMDQSITANPNEIMGEPTEEKITDAGDTKEKTPEVQQNFTTIVSNENAEKNSLIQVDASQEKHEELFENEREIPALSETLMVETNNQESTVIQEDKIEDEDVQKIDVNKQEESTSLKEEAQLDKLIEPLHAAPGDSKTSASCQDIETTSSLVEQSVTENPKEIEGEQTEGKIVDAAGKKERISETNLQNFTTTVSNENSEDNSLPQMDGSKIKHEELLYKESEIPSLSETLAANTNSEESKIIHEDNNAGSNLLKEEVQVDHPIKSLKVADEEIEAAVSCQDPETSSLKERSLTENPQEIVGGQTEDKIIDTADIKEAQTFPPIFSYNNAENNTLIQLDVSQRKHEELFEKEREIPALSETLTAETTDKESIIIHEEKIEDENIKKVTEYESEEHIENTFLNEEARVDTPIESLNIATEDGKASASCQETETSSRDEQSLTANSQEIEGNQTEHKIIDATNTKEKSQDVQDFATILTNENSEDISLLQMDESQMKHEILLEKEREIPSLSENSVVETSNQESIITCEKKIEDEDLKKDMFESERHAERTLSKEEGYIGKPIKSLQEAPEDNKASCQHIETTSSLKEPSLIENTQFDDQIENQVSVGPDTKEETPEARGLATVVSNEKTEEISLEKETEISSLSEASIVETNNEESTVMHEVKIENKDLEKHAESTLLKEDGQVDQHIDSLHVSFDENEASVSCQDPETTCSLEEQTLTENIQEIVGGQTEDKVIDTAETKEKTLEAQQNSTTSVSNENAEKKKLIQVDASGKKHEELFENEREIPAISEPLMVESNNQESTVIQEDKIGDEDLQKVDAYEQEESASLKEEAQLDKPIESLQEAPGDSKASASCQDTETSFLEEGSQTENPQEIKGDQTEDKIIDAADTKEKTTETHLQNFEITVTNENIEENSLLQMDGSQIKHEELLKESETQSLSETLAANTNNEESKIIHEDKDAGSTLLKEDVQVDKHNESLHVALDENEASVSCQDPESTCSLEEQRLTENTQEILGGQTEDKIIDTAETKEKTLEAQNSTTSILNENAEKKKFIPVDASEKKHEEFFENEREIPALSEPLTVETNNQVSTVIQEDEIENENLQNVDVYEQEESTSLKEEAQVDKPIESLQVAPGDSKASASCEDTETSLIEKGSLTENPQEIKGDQTEYKIIDAANTKEKTTETHQNFATVTNENIEENSRLQMDGSKIKHEELLNKESEIASSSETLAVNTNNEEPKIIHEDKDAGSILSKEEVQADQHIEFLQVGLEENEASVSCQESETTCSLEKQTLTENTQEIVGGQTEDKIIDTTETKEKTLEAQQNFTTIFSNESAEKNSLIQVDASQEKHEELFENEREIPALSETLMVETNNQVSTVIQEDKIEDEDVQKIDVNKQEESTSLKEEAQLDKLIEPLHAAPGDSKTSASCQDIETTSSLVEQSLTENPKEIEGEQTEDKIVDAAGKKERISETNLQNFTTTVSNENIEENSLLQMDGSKIKHEELLYKESEISSLSETLAVNTNEAPKIIHEDNDAGSNLLKEEVQVGHPIESLQVALEEIEASVSCQDPETTRSFKERSLTENPQEIVGGQTEDKIIDTAKIKEKTPEARNSTTIVSNENAENSLIQVDASQKKHELLENEREIPALSEPLMVKTNNQESTVIQEDDIEDEDLQKVDVYEQEESTSLKEEAQVDKPIEYLQAAPGDSKASASCQDTETSFIEEGSLTENPQEINGDQTEDKIIDAADAKEKTTETHNFATVINEYIEENSRLQMDGSKIKHEELLNKESEIPFSSEILAVNTNKEEPKIIHEDKDAGSTLSKEEVQADQHIESLQMALEEQRLTENTQELVSGQTEDKIIDTAHIKEKTPEAHNFTTIVSNENAGKNSLIEADASQKKHEELIENDREIPALSQTVTAETNNEESIIIHEDKTEDQVVKKIAECESEKQTESTFLHAEAQAGKLFESLHVAPEDCKVSRQDTETSSFLEEQSLTENPQEIVGDQIEEKITDAANTKEKTPYTHDFAMIVTNDKTDDDLQLQMDGSQLKHEELLGKEGEVPSSSETLAEEANNEESTIIHNDKSEDEDLKTVDVFEEKHAICTLSMEQSRMDEPIEPLQVAPEDIKASCQHLEKASSPNEQSVAAYPQFANQTEDKIYDAPDTKEKTPEAQGFTVLSNENIEENAQIQVDESQTRHEEVLETKREIPSLSETLTVETNNEETAIIQEDKIEVENLKNDDIIENEKYAESNLLKEEAWVHQVASEDINASASCQDRETRISLEDQSPTANPQEIVGDQAHAETIDAADTKEKTREVQVSTILDPTTIISGENAENNSLIQLEASQKKHEETESETPTPSDTLMVESDNEKSTIIHEDKIEDKDLKEDIGYTSIESLEGVPVDIKASPSCLDTETTSSLEERSLTANPQEIVGDQTDDTIIDAADTKEESLDTQDFATNETNDQTEGNSLLKMDGSQLKHEELLEKEREMPSLSETLVQEANNEESTILHKDKFEDEDQKTVDAFETEKFIESTQLKEETKVGKHVESLQITPEDFNASASCQDQDTTSTLVEQSLTANVQETVSEQTEDKIIVTADTKDKTPDALKNVTKMISFEDNESAIPCCKSSDLDPTNQLKEEELNDSNIIQEMKVPEGDYIPSLDENMIETMNRKESEAAEDATNYKRTENLQHEDTTESIMDDQKHLEPTEKNKEEAERKVTLNQTMEKTKESTLAAEDHSATERELTIDREEMHIGKTAKDGDEAEKIDKDDEEEDKGKKNISDFSSEAPIMIEARDEEVARLVYEAADEKITSGVAEESNILNGVTETGDSKVLKREMTQEDTLDTVKSIEGLEIISHDKDPEILTTTSKVIKGQEVGNLSVSETSVLVSQSVKDNLDVAQIGSVTEEKFKSNEVDFADRESTSVCESNDQGVKELKSLEITTIGNKSEENDKEINSDDGTGYKTKNESVEEETQDDINYVPEKQELQDSVSLSKELPFKTSSKMEKITYDGEANEDSVELGEEETLRDVGNLNYNARTKEDNDTVNSISESSETVEPENMEVVTETDAQLQICELISKVEDPYTKEDKLEEAAAEIKSGKIVAEDILDPKETMKVYVSTDKDGKMEVKEETEGAKNHHIGSCKEEIVLDNYCQEDDSRINTEEIFESIKNADEDKKVSKVLGEANATDNINEQIVFDDKAVEEPDEIIQVNEPKDGSLHQQEKEKSVDQVTTGLDTKEKEHDLDYLIEKTSIEDPREEVNSSILVFQEEEDNRTGANAINNVMTKDAELLTMNNKNANTTMMELQEHRESKHGSLLPCEVLQVQDSDKQEKMDETFSSDKVQGKDEISMPQEKETISARKSDVEADRVENLSRITEDENNKNKIEVELIERDSKAKAITAESGTDSVDVTETGGENGQEENASDDSEGMAEPSTSMVSTEIVQEHATGDQENQDQLTELYELPLLSHVEDSEVGMAQKQGPVNLQTGSGTADNVQDSNECCFTVTNMGNLQGENSDENVEVKVSSGGKEADIIQQDLVSNTVKQEMPEQQLANTVANVSDERGMNSEEDKIKDASCYDSQENSSSVDTDKVAPSNILQGSIGDEAQGAKSQEIERQHSSLPILPHTKCSDMEIAQKDIPLHFEKKDEDDLKELEAAPLPTTDKPIVLEADHADNASSNISMLQHGDSSGSSLTEGEKQEPSKFEKEEEKCGHEETTKPMKTEQSTEIDKHSLSDLLQLPGKETLQDVDHFTVKPTIQKEDLREENSNEAAHEEAKTDGEKDDEEELSEHKSSDMSSEAPVMVEAGDTDVKVSHKKSHNILSGVGSKVKHSIAKVKKAITGKSSHPKSHSPKYGEKI